MGSMELAQKLYQTALDSSASPVEASIALRAALQLADKELAQGRDARRARISGYPRRLPAVVTFRNSTRKDLPGMMATVNMAPAIDSLIAEGLVPGGEGFGPDAIFKRSVELGLVMDGDLFELEWIPSEMDRYLADHHGIGV